MSGLALQYRPVNSDITYLWTSDALPLCEDDSAIKEKDCEHRDCTIITAIQNILR
jgi:hypothetical protein